MIAPTRNQRTAAFRCSLSYASFHRSTFVLETFQMYVAGLGMNKYTHTYTYTWRVTYIRRL